MPDRSTPARVVRFHEIGGPEVLIIDNEPPTSPGPGVLSLAEMLAPGGRLVLYGNLSGQAAETPFPFIAAVGKGLAVEGYLVFGVIQDPLRLEAAIRFIKRGLAEGKLKPVIAKSFRLEEIVEAHRYLESNRQFGKIVVTAGSDRREV